jgi:hypothetical protein
LEQISDFRDAETQQPVEDQHGALPRCQAA